MKGYLLPIIKSNFSFKPTLIMPGIFCINCSDPNIWKKDKNFNEFKYLNVYNNFCLFVSPRNFQKIEFGSRIADIETFVDVALLFFFLKTKRRYEPSVFFKSNYNLANNQITTSPNPINPFNKYGYVLGDYHNFLDGSDRTNILTKKLFDKTINDIKEINKYFILLEAQLPRYWKTPLSRAMEFFSCGFCNDGRDEAKFLLLFSALEALFSRSSSELVYRLSNNIARFIYPNEASFELRLNKKDAVKKLYNLRSKVTHGAYIEIKPEDYDQALSLFVEIIEKIISNKQILDIFLDEKKHEKFIKYLEIGHLMY